MAFVLICEAYIRVLESSAPEARIAGASRASPWDERKEQGGGPCGAAPSRRSLDFLSGRAAWWRTGAQARWTWWVRPKARRAACRRRRSNGDEHLTAVRGPGRAGTRRREDDGSGPRPWDTLAIPTGRTAVRTHDRCRRDPSRPERRITTRRRTVGTGDADRIGLRGDELAEDARNQAFGRGELRSFGAECRGRDAVLFGDRSGDFLDG